MKKNLLLVVAALSAFSIHAQIQFGVKGGLNLSNPDTIIACTGSFLQPEARI